MAHLTLRVPWHDAEWRGVICNDPIANCHCLDYQNIRESKDAPREARNAGRPFAELKADELPACAKESGGFLSPTQWLVSHSHPYVDIRSTKETHGHLQPVQRTMPPYTALGVPFSWLRRNNTEWVQEQIDNPLPPDVPFPPKFNSNWIFGRALQEAVLDGFFSKVRPGESLAFFYTKGDHPLGEGIPRLIVGVATVTEVGPFVYYGAPAGAPTLPVWERAVSHGLRPDGVDGVLLPYHQYLAPTGDPAEDDRRRLLLAEIAVGPEPGHVASFSYRTELAPDDAAVSVLTALLGKLALIREHAVAEGPWAAREEWVNDQLARAWRLRGPHPGIGPVLEAMGMRLGTSLVRSLSETGRVAPGADPWPLVDAVMRGDKPVPHPRYQADVAAARSVWLHIRSDAEKRQLAELLSRFSLTPQAAHRWWDPDQRRKATDRAPSDNEILENPYLICEADLGEWVDSPVPMTVIDRGVFPDAAVTAASPPPEGPAVESSDDRRRRRAALVDVLRRASREGDGLLAAAEARSLVEALPLAHPVTVPPGWLDAEEAFNAGTVEHGRTPRSEFEWVQLAGRRHVAGKLQSVLGKRATRSLPSLGEDWRGLLVETVRHTLADEEHTSFDPLEAKVAAALDEQAEALETITTRKLACLVGRAGTGKTTLLGALARCASLRNQVLFLAPTGKARVRLESRVDGAATMTVAQFLWRLGRYDGERQRPIAGDPVYGDHQAVVIDEASMLTEDDLLAVISALSPAVKRVILSGDPSQLPPIGVGRPFADLVAHLDPATTGEVDDEDPEETRIRRGALARLSREVRSRAGTRSDTLRLAAWFTNEPQPPDADQVLADLAGGAGFNDLDVRFWTTPDELHGQIAGALRDHLGVTESGDTESFNRAFALEPFKQGWVVPRNNHSGSEAWQILSPVRAEIHGVEDLNRWVQGTWRGKQLQSARNYYRTFGDQEIIRLDKVILLSNGERSGYDQVARTTVDKKYLANGEVGLAVSDKDRNTRFGPRRVMDVAFAGREPVTFGFFANEFGGEDSSPKLELAYALTVHKAQGSEFRVVIVVLPQRTRLAYRELVYTALTRSRDQMVLLIEGEGVSDLLSLSRPDKSETARRNSNIFRYGLRQDESRPFADHLVHSAADGTLLRSKSELFIYTRCLDAGLRPMYEQRLDGDDGSWRLPDFTVMNDAGDAIVWEHLGMLSDPDYADSWKRKLDWYDANGFKLNANLFTTDEVGGLDARAVEATLRNITEAIGT